MSQRVTIRLVLYTKDVEIITGYRPQAARRLLNKIRAKLGKPPRSFISIEEFSEHTGINMNTITKFMS